MLACLHVVCLWKRLHVRAHACMLFECTCWQAGAVCFGCYTAGTLHEMVGGGVMRLSCKVGLLVLCTGWMSWHWLPNAC